MSTAKARAYQPRFAGRFVSFEMQKSPQNKAFYGHWSTYSGNAHCIKDSVLLDAKLPLLIQEHDGRNKQKVA